MQQRHPSFQVLACGEASFCLPLLSRHVLRLSHFSLWGYINRNTSWPSIKSSTSIFHLILRSSSSLARSYVFLIMMQRSNIQKAFSSYSLRIRVLNQRWQLFLQVFCKMIPKQLLIWTVFLTSILSYSSTHLIISIISIFETTDMSSYALLSLIFTSLHFIYIKLYLFLKGALVNCLSKSSAYAQIWFDFQILFPSDRLHTTRNCVK